VAKHITFAAGFMFSERKNCKYEAVVGNCRFITGKSQNLIDGRGINLINYS